MTDEELRATLVDMDAEDAMIFTNPTYSTAILGVAENEDGDNVVVYDYEKMVEYLMEKDGMSCEEACDWIDYNAIRSLPYMGSRKPIIVYPLQ